MKKLIDPKIIGIGLYILIFILALVAIQQFWFSNLFDKANFLNWDAEHYYFIKEKGYEGFRVAFFPMFPLIWRYLSVGIHGIVVINALIFLLSFCFLVKNLEINRIEEIVLYLSIPSFMFFYLPYSESFFFVCSVLIVIGLKKNKDYLLFIGLFFSILVRPAFTIFIPALIIVELLSKRSEIRYLRIGAYILLSFICLFIVAIIQFDDTGEWFKFFSEQKGWGNHLQIPHLPLTSWGGGFVVRADGFAFLIGLLAGGYLTGVIFKLKWLKGCKPPKDVLFSLAYLGGITLSVLIFRGGSLFSLNRFVFATPLIIIAFHYWMNQTTKLSLKKLLMILGILFSFWLFFGSYVHIQQVIKFALLSVYALLIFAVQSEIGLVRKFSLLLLIIFNITFQIIFYVMFLSGEWIG